MIADDYLICDVSDELFWNPKVTSETIVVDAEQGVVTLRGTVGSPREKHEAKKAAVRVHGVLSVANQLRVRLMDDQKRQDAEIRAVTIEGTVSSWAEHDQALQPAWAAPGVKSVEDHLKVVY